MSSSTQALYLGLVGYERSHATARFARDFVDLTEARLRSEGPGRSPCKLDLGGDDDDCQIILGAETLRWLAPSLLCFGAEYESLFHARWCHTELAQPALVSHSRVGRSPSSPGYLTTGLLEKLQYIEPGLRSLDGTPGFARRLALPDICYETGAFLMAVGLVDPVRLARFASASSDRTLLSHKLLRDLGPLLDCVPPVGAEISVLARCQVREDKVLNRGGAAADSLPSVLARLQDDFESALVCRLAALTAEPALSMRDLLLAKSAVASVAHGSLRLGADRWDALFERFHEAPSEFLDALAASRWIVPGHPERSQLVALLSDAAGPMGEVLSCVDLAIVRRWIRSLRRQRASFELEYGPNPTSTVSTGPPHTMVGPSPTQEHIDDPRVLYHRLLVAPSDADTRVNARRWAERWLDRSHANSSSTWSPPSQFDVEGFCVWFDDSVTQISAQPEPTDLGIPGDVATLALHEAPSNLLDAVWLQNIVRSRPFTDVHQSLHSIFWDELGAGESGRNHRNIYREVLAYHEIVLPDITSEAFAFDSRFLDEDFLEASFLMALSEFPESLLPEIVGANLAIEFSGIGSSMLAYISEMEGRGLNVSFLRAHVAADNAEAGHAAQSRDAVLLLMQHAAVVGQVKPTWDRVVAGIGGMRSTNALRMAAIAEHMSAG